MQEFIHEQNLALYRRLLATELDDAKRGVIQRLFDDEEKWVPDQGGVR